MMKYIIYIRNNMILLDIYNQVNMFKTKINPLIIGLKLNKPNYRDIFSTNYNINLMHILTDIFYSNSTQV
jgi:hypothetical protein